MDPFDEFEFKPLTEGLGFHKKTMNLKESLKSTGVIDDKLDMIPALEHIEPAPVKRHTFDDVLSALEKTPLQRTQTLPPELQFTDTLPRVKQAISVDVPVNSPSVPPVQSPFPKIETYKKVPSQKDMSSVGTRRGAADSPQSRLMPATISFASAFLDLIIVTAFALVFLSALLFVTKVDLGVVFANVNRDNMTRVSLGLLFVTVMQLYVVIARSYFGQTIGEWTFDLQIGQDEEQRLESYPLRIVLRSFLNVITGIILLPLVSALIGRDVAGQMSGVKLYRQRF